MENHKRLTIMVFCMLLTLVIYMYLSNIKVIDSSSNSSAESIKQPPDISPQANSPPPDMPPQANSPPPDMPPQANSPPIDIPQQANSPDFKNRLIKSARAIQHALIHAKSMKARKALKIAKQEISVLLKSFTLKYQTVTSRTVNNPRNVCPEIFKGTNYGFHLWNTGFVETKCSHKRQTQDLITIITVGKYLAKFDLPPSLNTVKVFVSILKSSRHSQLKNSSLQLIFHEPNTSEADIWKTLLGYVTTEYVLFARDITCFDEHMRLERLIRAIETLGVSAAAGAFRNNNGHWKIGCRQRAMRNYTLVYQDGYDESLKECIFCDDVEGPFVIQTKKARSIRLDTLMTGKGLFEDFFLRLGDEESVVCPDVMFHVNTFEDKSTWKEWNLFAKKWKLSKILFGKNKKILFPCDIKTLCSKPKSVALTPCCLQILSQMLSFISSLCIRYNVMCEIDAGTLMGAVKLSKVLPWDIDADLIFTSSQYDLLKSLKDKVKQAGYSMRLAQNPRPNKKFNNTLDSGEVDVISNGWTVELFGRWVLNSEKFKKEGKNQTKVNINGKWIVSPSNPGLYARNRYGEEIYKHVPHWRHLGYKHSYIIYENVGQFQKCIRPGHHNCLDLFLGDGNLQFDDPIP